MARRVGWVLILIQLPPGPSRHRVAVWRELRKGGAVPVASGTWALPSGPAFQPTLDRAGALCHGGGGTFAVIDAAPRDAAAEALDLKKRDILQLTEARSAEERLRGCEALLDGYADQVYEAMRNVDSALGEPAPLLSGGAPHGD